MPTAKQIIVRKPSPQETQACQAWPVWTCNISRFDYCYDAKETCLILEGAVTVSNPDGSESISFGPGDLVIFPKGLECRWSVTRPVRKHYNFE